MTVEGEVNSDGVLNFNLIELNQKVCIDINDDLSFIKKLECASALWCSRGICFCKMSRIDKIWFEHDLTFIIVQA